MFFIFADTLPTSLQHFMSFVFWPAVKINPSSWSMELGDARHPLYLHEEIRDNTAVDIKCESKPTSYLCSL